MGGVPVLGYDVAPEGGRLLVNAVEAGAGLSVQCAGTVHLWTD